jgi:hypothetical protein
LLRCTLNVDHLARLTIGLSKNGFKSINECEPYVALMIIRLIVIIIIMIVMIIIIK